MGSLRRRACISIMAGPWCGKDLEKISGGIKKPLPTVKIERILNKLGYNTRILNGHKKYHVRGLQYADIQEIKSREALTEDGAIF